MRINIKMRYWNILKFCFNFRFPAVSDVTQSPSSGNDRQQMNSTSKLRPSIASQRQCSVTVLKGEAIRPGRFGLKY